MEYFDCLVADSCLDLLILLDFDLVGFSYWLID